jgi:hypothetical protein
MVVSNFFWNSPIRVRGLRRRTLVAKAHTICLYLEATRGNFEVKLLTNRRAVESGAT